MKVKLIDIFFAHQRLLVRSKGNIHFSEPRDLPIPDRIFEILCLLSRKAWESVRNEPAERQDVFWRSLRLFQEEQKVKDKLRDAMRSVGFLDDNPYVFRRFGATRLHARENFVAWRAIMGHQLTGFEFLGPFSRSRPSSLKTALKKHVEEFSEYLQKTIGLIEKTSFRIFDLQMKPKQERVRSKRWEAVFQELATKYLKADEMAAATKKFLSAVKEKEEESEVQVESDQKPAEPEVALPADDKTVLFKPSEVLLGNILLIWKRGCRALVPSRLETLRHNLRSIMASLPMEEIGRDGVFLHFPKKRKLAVDLYSLMDKPPDLANAVLWGLRLGPRQGKKETWLRVRFLAEFLHQGMPLSYALRVDHEHLFPRKNIVLVPDGKTFRVVPVDPSFYAFVLPIAKRIKLPILTDRKDSRTARSWSRSVEIALSELIPENGRPKNVKEWFRQVGLWERAIQADIQPACLSNFAGPEIARDCPGLKTLFPSAKAEGKQVETKSRKEWGITEHLESNWTFVRQCRSLLDEYADKLRFLPKDKRASEGKLIKDELRAKLRGIQQKADVKDEWRYVFDWIEDLFRRKRQVNTGARYLNDIADLMDYCLFSEKALTALDKDDLLDFILSGEDDVAYGTGKAAQNALTSFFGFLGTKEIQMPMLRFSEILPYLDKSPKLVEIPLNRNVRKQISKYWKSDNPKENDAALYGILVFCLGLRVSEAFALRVGDFRYVETEAGFVELNGKFGKFRRLPLRILDAKMGKILRTAIEQKRNSSILASGNRILESCDTVGQVQYLHEKYWDELAPSGPHSMRHGFASWELRKGGASYVRAACWMGHASLRTLQNTYDQFLWRDAIKTQRKHAKPFNCPEWISLKEFSRLIGMSDGIYQNRKMRDWLKLQGLEFQIAGDNDWRHGESRFRIDFQSAYKRMAKEISNFESEHPLSKRIEKVAQNIGK